MRRVADEPHGKKRFMVFSAGVNPIPRLMTAMMIRLCKKNAAGKVGNA
jgi:hypothetical protein